jgi:hypothetical protein
VALEPVPIEAIPPGVLINVHVPEAGKLPSNTLPVADEHVGCVTCSIVGAAGVTMEALITTLADGDDTHPSELVTV